MEEKKYTKTKIFLFLFFFLILLVFFVNVYNFIKDSFLDIENKKNEINCLSFKYDIEAENLNSNIYITLKNYGYPIENFTIIKNNETILFYKINNYFEKDKNESIKNDIINNQVITIKTNLTNEIKEIYAYVNDCKDSIKEIKIKK